MPIERCNEICAWISAAVSATCGSAEPEAISLFALTTGRDVMFNDLLIQCCVAKYNEVQTEAIRNVYSIGCYEVFTFSGSRRE